MPEEPRSEMEDLRGAVFGGQWAPPAEPARVSPGVAALAAAIVIAAGAVGFLVGRLGGGSGDVASSGGVRVTEPEGWGKTAAPSVPGLRLSQPVALAPHGTNGTAVLAGLVEAPRASAFPDRFLAQLGLGPARADVVRLGSYDAYRYRSLSLGASRRRLTLFLAPTSSGLASVACVAAAGNTDFLPRCEKVAASLAIPDSPPSGLDADRHYASAVVAIATELARSRAAGRRRLLGARAAAQQAEAGRQLARAYDEAAAKLSSASVPPLAEDANSALVAAVEAVGPAYGDYARAARNGDRGAYASARRTVVRREAALERALEAL